jgi:hypothetical protein
VHRDNGSSLDRNSPDLGRCDQRPIFCLGIGAATQAGRSGNGTGRTLALLPLLLRLTHSGPSGHRSSQIQPVWIRGSIFDPTSAKSSNRVRTTERAAGQHTGSGPNQYKVLAPSWRGKNLLNQRAHGHTAINGFTQRYTESCSPACPLQAISLQIPVTSSASTDVPQIRANLPLPRRGHSRRGSFDCRTAPLLILRSTAPSEIEC